MRAHSKLMRFENGVSIMKGGGASERFRPRGGEGLSPLSPFGGDG